MANIQNPLELNPTVGGKQYAAGISKTKMQSLVDEVNKVGDKYEKPSGGIPSSDLSSSVQNSLAKADDSVSEGNLEDVIDGLHEEYGDPTRLNQLEDWGNIADEATLRSWLRNVSNLSQAHTQRISFTVGGKTGFAIVTYNGEEFYVEYTLGSNRYACKQDANESGGWTPWLGSTELETYKHLDELDTRCDEQEADIRGESNRAKEAEALLDERKADVEGSYESMAVGSAKTLEANTLTAVDFTKRVVPSSVGSGASKLSLLRGNTLVWNQQCNIETSTFNECTITKNINGTFTVSGSGSYARYKAITPAEFGAIGHKILYRFKIISGSGVSIYDSNNLDTAGGYIRTDKEFIYTQEKKSTFMLVRSVNANEDFTFSFVCFDITLMFGAGNEPTSVAEFEALFPRENYAYATPWLMNFQGTGLKSTGSDFEQTLPLNVTTLKGKAEGSDTEVVMFPDGLKKAGNIYDEIDFKNGIAIKRVGSVDLGSLSYTKNQVIENVDRFYATVRGIKYSDESKEGNAVCGIYATMSLTIANTGYVNVIAIYKTEVWIYVPANSYTDAATFKAAMNGVILYYELATPIVYHFEPLNNVYRVEQGGTEEVETRDTITPEGYNPLTAPMRADIRYGVDVVGILGNLKKDYVSKESIEVFLSALGTQMGGTWSMTWNETTERYDFAFTPNA